MLYLLAILLMVDLAEHLFISLASRISGSSESNDEDEDVPRGGAGLDVE